MNLNAIKRSRGFTLAELAVAFFVIALLLAGALMPLSTQVEVRNIADTRRSMDGIRDALIGFALANGRMPCPARGATPIGQSDNSYGEVFTAGSEQYDSSNLRCYTALGVVPWATLGVPETDAWGRRLTYRIAPVFADTVGTTWSTSTATTPASPADQSPVCSPTPTPTQSSFALCTMGDIAVLTRSAADHAAVTPLGSGLAGVVISHGRNGKGAWQTTGVALASAAAGTDELANSQGNTTGTPTGGYLSNVFYSRDPTPEATTCSDTSGTAFCEFDDIVMMISAPTLISRMVAAGRLP